MDYKRLFATLALFSLLVVSLPALSWDATGHRLVAQIAYTHLNKRARQRVDQLTQVIDAKYPPQSRFLYGAVWPDLLVVRDGITAFSPWHYISIGFSPDGTPIPPPGNQNVVWAIGEMQHVIDGKKPNMQERAFALRFLTHLVGDIHQPLHCIERVTKAHPNGDRGGNLFPIQDLYANNLHAYWDKGLGLFRRPSKRHPLRAKQIRRLAVQIQQEYPEGYFGKKINDLDPKTWAATGFRLAKGFVYKTQENASPTPQYVKEGKEIVKQRIALAGYRLARLLNNLRP